MFLGSIFSANLQKSRPDDMKNIPVVNAIRDFVLKTNPHNTHLVFDSHSKN